MGKRLKDVMKWTRLKGVHVEGFGFARVELELEPDQIEVHRDTTDESIHIPVALAGAVGRVLEGLDPQLERDVAALTPKEIVGVLLNAVQDRWPPDKYACSCRATGRAHTCGYERYQALYEQLLDEIGGEGRAKRVCAHPRQIETAPPKCEDCGATLA